MDFSSMENLVDLTREISNGDPGVEVAPAKSIELDGWNATTLKLYSHSGTHMDAPKHFDVNDQTIDEIPLQRCITKAWVVDLTFVKPKALITVEDLGDVAEKIEEGDSLLLKTGWSHYFKTSKYRDELPRVSKELALWFVKKKINILGVEPPSVADVNNLAEVTEIHEILLSGNIIIIEGLINLEKLKTTQPTLIALPLKIKNGDGSPARVIAIDS